MKRALLDILRCPIDQGELHLSVTKEEDDEIVEGTLACQRCSESYPIKESIPRMLPPELRKEIDARLGASG